MMSAQTQNVSMPGNGFEAVVFDLDGTLLNTLDDIAGSMNRVLADRSWPVHPVDGYRRFVGDGVEMLARRSVPGEVRDEGVIKACVQEFKEVYSRNWDVHTAIYPGIDTLLDALEEKGLKKGVLSNKPHEFTLKCVDRFLSAWNFEAVLGLTETIQPKPDPTGARKMGRKLGIALDKILFLGDSGVDMQTAFRAGMFSVGVLWGFRSAEELLASGAKRLIRRPQELLDLLA